MLNNELGQELCQISLTGVRSLVLLGLLIQAPRSLEEIKEEFIKLNLTEESNSYDILRIDLNTLRTMGCEISRADKRTNNKYVLIKHPFELNINKEEINLLKRAFNRIKESADLKLLIKYDKLFKKLSEQIFDTELKEQLLGISPLKKYHTDVINKLEYCCQNNKTITLIYKSGLAKSPSEKEVAAQKLVYKNDKIYLYGFDKSMKESVTLNIKRILKIISSKDSDDNIKSNPVIIKFKLKQFGISGLEDAEKILNGDVENGFIIEGQYHNKFVATQRILSFGSDCTILEPQDFKEHVIELLKKMKEIYNG